MEARGNRMGSSSAIEPTAPVTTGTKNPDDFPLTEEGLLMEGTVLDRARLRL
jgi:hypothetical protein